MVDRHLKKAAGILCCIVLLCALAVGAWALEPPACEHQYSITVITEATEDTDGQCRYTCDICGRTFLETIPRSGHIWGAWQITKEPGCTEAGEERRQCTKYPDAPHEECREVPALGHDFGEWVTDRDASVFHEGHACRVCGRCNETEEMMLEKIPPNKMDYIFCGVLAVGTVGIGYPLIPAAGVMRWYKRKKAEYAGGHTT